MLFSGWLDLPWWGYVLVALALTHITIAAVTIYLHRCQAHRALELHPVVSHFFRFWLWLTTGMVTKEWAAIHRKHHAKVRDRRRIRTARRSTASTECCGSACSCTSRSPHNKETHGALRSRHAR